MTKPIKRASRGQVQRELRAMNANHNRGQVQPPPPGPKGPNFEQRTAGLANDLRMQRKRKEANDRVRRAYRELAAAKLKAQQGKESS